MIKDILHAYEKASSRMRNLEKSGIYFNKNVETATKDSVCKILGFIRKLDDELYLGLPLTFGKNRSREFREVIDKVRSRVQSWNSHFLSNSGRKSLLTLVHKLPQFIQ